MRLGIRQSQAETDVDVTYVCERCDAERDAIVKSFGWSSWPSFIGDDDDAIARADQDAVARAEKTLMFVPCPKCGHRQSGRGGVVFTTILTHAAGALAAGVAMGVVAFMKGMDDEFMIWGSLGVAAVMAVILGHRLVAWRWQPWADAAKRTTFSNRPLTRDASSPRPSASRRAGQTELRSTKKKVLYAALAALALGGVAAAVQLADRPTSHPHALPTPKPTADPLAHPSDDQPLRYPIRHVVELDGRRLDVLEGSLEVERNRRAEELRVLKPWAFRGEVVSFLYDPSLTVVDDGRTVCAYDDAGEIRIAPASLDDDAQVLQELRDSLPANLRPSNSLSAETSRRPIGGESRQGQRFHTSSGDDIELFAPTLEGGARLGIVIRRTGVEPPSHAALLASLTTRKLPQRALYRAVLGKRTDLMLGEPTFFAETGAAVTLQPRPTIRRAIGSWRFEHPADVVVMARPRGQAGEVIVFARGSVELEMIRSPSVLSPTAVLSELRSPGGAAEPTTLSLPDGELAGVRSSEPGTSDAAGPKPIHEAFVASSQGASLGIVTSFDEATRAEAHALLRDVLAPLRGRND